MRDKTPGQEIPHSKKGIDKKQKKGAKKRNEKELASYRLFRSGADADGNSAFLRRNIDRCKLVTFPTYK